MWWDKVPSAYAHSSPIRGRNPPRIPSRFSVSFHNLIFCHFLAGHFSSIVSNASFSNENLSGLTVIQHMQRHTSDQTQYSALPQGHYSDNMNSSISEFPSVARLCSNCEKAQFRDDVPQLFQAGSHLEFDQEHFPPRRVFSTPGRDGARKFELWGIIPTEFELMDSLPELPKLLKSSQDGCDLCRFLHEAITVAHLKQRNTRDTPSHRQDVYVTISYTWGPLRQADTSGVKSVYKRTTGLNAMEITMEVSPKKTIREIFRIIDCEVQSLCGEYSHDLAQQVCIRFLVAPHR